MSRVGDTIQVNISGGPEGTKLSGRGGASIGLGSGASMSVPGKIIRDLGDRWLVKLSISLGGADTVQVPK